MTKLEESVVGHTGGRESQLGIAAGWWVFISICAFIAGVGLAIDAFNRYGEEWVGAIWITAAVVMLVQSILVFYFCEAVADILRVLKKQVDLPFGGKVREPKTTYGFTCSECGTEVFAPFIRCNVCNKEFTKEDSS